jgi:hypothetical protein
MNAIPSNGKMTFKDAAIVATIVTVFLCMTVFMPLWGLADVQSNPAEFEYKLSLFIVTTWMTQFMLYTGLNVYAQRAQKNGG